MNWTGGPILKKYRNSRTVKAVDRWSNFEEIQEQQNSQSAHCVRHTPFSEQFAIQCEPQWKKQRLVLTRKLQH